MCQLDDKWRQGGRWQCRAGTSEVDAGLDRNRRAARPHTFQRRSCQARAALGGSELSANRDRNLSQQLRSPFRMLEGRWQEGFAAGGMLLATGTAAAARWHEDAETSV